MFICFIDIIRYKKCKKILKNLKNCLNLVENHNNCQKFSEKIGNLGVSFIKSDRT